MNKILEKWMKLEIAGDSRERSQLIVLNIIGLFLILTSLAGLSAVLFFKNAVAPISTFAITSSLILMGLLRTKYWRWANILYPTILMGALTAQSYYNDGLFDELVYGFFAVIAISGLLLRRRGVVVSTIASDIAILGLGYAHSSGLITKYGEHFTVQRVAILEVMVALGGALLFLVINNLVTSIDQLSDKEESLKASNQELQIARETLEKRVIERTSAAELARAEADIARHEAEAQAWFAHGQAQLAEKMRGDQNIETLANSVIACLCQYLGAHTGALFLASDGILKLTGRYAYVDHANRKSEFRFGENLVGEIANTRNVANIINIPDDALLISSALGATKPKQLLIAAIETDGQVYGVVELATLNNFSVEHEAFLRRVSEGIAIGFRTTLARVQINDLLIQAQRQAEELQAQEEELRAANEELQAQFEGRANAAQKHKGNKYE